MRQLSLNNAAIGLSNFGTRKLSTSGHLSDSISENKTVQEGHYNETSTINEFEILNAQGASITDADFESDEWLLSEVNAMEAGRK